MTAFTLKRGEALGILGHNGAGKSTLLQIIAGTLTPTSGRVLVRGRVGTMMTMGSGFRLDFTGRENTYVLGSLLGFSRDEIHQQIAKIENFAEIGIFFDQPVRTYSSGMLPRMAFAVYTCLHPELLIIDEILAVGDAAFKEKCLRHMSDMLSKGMAMLLVSHNPGIVQQFCHRAFLIRRGRLVYEGNVESVIKEYQINPSPDIP